MSNNSFPAAEPTPPALESHSQPRRPLMPYYGGKHRIRGWIVSHFPEHHAYVEAFGGAGSVLLAKPPSPIEVYNDLDASIVHLFQVLRNADLAPQLIERLRLTPYARREFLESYLPVDDPVEAAARTLIRAFMGRGSSVSRPGPSGFAVTRTGSSKAHSFASFPDTLPDIIHRLRHVVIEEQDAKTVIRRYDASSTLYYLDPPYLHSTRTSQRVPS